MYALNRRVVRSQLCSVIDPNGSQTKMHISPESCNTVSKLANLNTLPFLRLPLCAIPMRPLLLVGEYANGGEPTNVNAVPGLLLA